MCTECDLILQIVRFTLLLFYSIVVLRYLVFFVLINVFYILRSFYILYICCSPALKPQFPFYTPFLFYSFYSRFCRFLISTHFLLPAAAPSPIRPDSVWNWTNLPTKTVSQLGKVLPLYDHLNQVMVFCKRKFIYLSPYRKEDKWALQIVLSCPLSTIKCQTNWATITSNLFKTPHGNYLSL